MAHVGFIFKSCPPSPIIYDDDFATYSPDLDHSEVTGPITTAELRAALSTTKQSSSYGHNCNTFIALQIKEFEDGILDTINQSWKMVNTEYNISSQWKHLIIVCIKKKWSSLSLDNQRGTAKSCAIFKIRKKLFFTGSSR